LFKQQQQLDSQGRIAKGYGGLTKPSSYPAIKKVIDDNYKKNYPQQNKSTPIRYNNIQAMPMVKLQSLPKRVAYPQAPFLTQQQNMKLEKIVYSKVSMNTRVPTPQKDFQRIVRVPSTQRELEIKKQLSNMIKGRKQQYDWSNKRNSIFDEPKWRGY